jgi:hypothetical protein
MVLRNLLLAGGVGLAMTGCAQTQPQRMLVVTEHGSRYVHLEDGRRVVVVRNRDWLSPYEAAALRRDTHARAEAARRDAHHRAEEARRHAHIHAEAARHDARRHAEEARHRAREAVRLAELSRPSTAETARIHAQADAARRAGEAARRAGEAARRQGEAARRAGEEARRRAERVREQCERGEIECEIIVIN